MKLDTWKSRSLRRWVFWIQCSENLILIVKITSACSRILTVRDERGRLWGQFYIIIYHYQVEKFAVHRKSMIYKIGTLPSQSKLGDRINQHTVFFSKKLPSALCHDFVLHVAFHSCCLSLTLSLSSFLRLRWVTASVCAFLAPIVSVHCCFKWWEVFIHSSFPGFAILHCFAVLICDF